MNAIIIDDEKRAHVTLHLLLQEYCPKINIVAQCENLPEGVKAIRKHNPDIVFLDIEMPGHSGLELLDFFDEDDIKFGIIFTTAYQEYAIQAFKLSAIDYLLKPINPDELVLAVERAEKNKNKKENLIALKENIQSETYKKIAIPTGNKLQFITINDIVYIKADGSYSELFLKDKTKHTVSRNLKAFEETFQNLKQFQRVQKSYIINENYITGFNKADGGYVELFNQFLVPVTSEKANQILQQIQMIKK
jgi:two-component system, LytTR family, response regulator